MRTRETIEEEVISSTNAQGTRMNKVNYETLMMMNWAILEYLADIRDLLSPKKDS